ncbi:hypothetical protein CR513_43082 [Mucuna pruriens]|uniref:Uncharacterized protein n=1 Tax=Mucuna pruriens TaxID=157652 RepID=A0A371FEZ3_MUCPR|nr:hypothetical protein CR513_43082 [Mucuna pruriens]
MICLNEYLRCILIVSVQFLRLTYLRKLLGLLVLSRSHMIVLAKILLQMPLPKLDLLLLILQFHKVREQSSTRMEQS